MLKEQREALITLADSPDAPWWSAGVHLLVNYINDLESQMKEVNGRLDGVISYALECVNHGIDPNCKRLLDIANGSVKFGGTQEVYKCIR